MKNLEEELHSLRQISINYIYILYHLSLSEELNLSAIHCILHPELEKNANYINDLF